MTSLKFAATFATATMAFVSIPAAAQYSAPVAAPQTVPVPETREQSAPTGKQLKLTPKAQKAIIDLQTAVKAKNGAAIPGLLAAAQAVAKTQDDRYAIGSLQLQAAIDSNDTAGLVTAADVIAANGATAAETAKIYQFAAQRFGAAKQYAPASAAVDKLLAIDPNNSEAMLLKSEMLFQQKRVPDSLAALGQAIDRKKASGAVPESWYQARVARAYDAKLPAVYGYSRSWVAAYPSPQHWRDTINIYRNQSGLDRVALIDMLRLSRATKALAGEADYTGWAQSLINRGYPAEGLALLQEGAASGSINLSSAGVAPLVTSAKTKAPGERGVLAAAGKTALTAATAKPAMLAADGSLDAGDYAQAATLYRAALGKPGVDRDLANLRLGEALAQSGDKAGATAALQAVGGTQTEIAQYWLTYLATRA